MIEKEGDLWGYHGEDAKVITTNGFIKNNGEAVMGRGVAEQAARRWHDVPGTLGNSLRGSGNHVCSLGHFSYNPGYEGHSDRAHVLPTKETFELVALPVKHRWWERADLELINRSLGELVSLADFKGWSRVTLVRPGCGNGQRDWGEVRPMVAGLLDDRFVVVNYG